MQPGGEPPVVVRPSQPPQPPAGPAPARLPAVAPVIPHTDIHLPKKSTAVALLAVAAVLAAASLFLGSRLFGRNTTQIIENGGDIDAATLSIDPDRKAVGIAAEDPSGLQVGALTTAEPVGVTNVRLGLVGDDRVPGLLLEGEEADIWQLTNAAGVLKLLHGSELRAQFSDQALSLSNSLNVADNTTLGNGAEDVLTINGTAVAIPNGLNLGEGVLFIDAGNRSVGVGTTDLGGAKLRVAGSVRADGELRAGSVRSDGTITAGSLRVSGELRGGSLRVGSTVISADLTVGGYIRAGSGPGWQVQRYTGSLNGGGSAQIAHGISSLPARLLLVSAFYKGNGGEAVPMTVEYTSSSISVSGGIPGRRYRVTITYSQDVPSW